MSDEHPPEPFVPTPANDPEAGPKPGEGVDDTLGDDLGTFGIPPGAPRRQPGYFPHDTPISDEDVPPTKRKARD